MTIQHLFVSTIFIGILLSKSNALFEVNLTSFGLSYGVNVTLGGQVLPMIVDTGNRELTVLNVNDSTIDFDTSDPNTYDRLNDEGKCLNLFEDHSYVIYFNDTMGGNCPRAKGTVQIENSLSTQQSMLSNVTFQVATQLFIENERLHDWRGAKGNLGLAYCGIWGCSDVWGPYYDVEVYGETKQMSTFQMLLYNVSGNASVTGTNMVVGLDYEGDDGDRNGFTSRSTMQLGEVKPKYSASMKWARQSTTFPRYHTFLATELSVCGINLMTSVGSYAWPTIVDTGQACVQLPGEMHDSLVSWLNPANRTFVGLADLPSLTLKIDEYLRSSVWNDNVEGSVGSESTSSAYSDYLYIPLSTLLLPPHYFNQGLDTAINVTVGSAEQSLCILRNADGGPPVMTQPAPRIVLGSMALRSLYFAADYTARAVGLANKLNSTQQEGFFLNDVNKCDAVQECIGHQTYDYSSNSCQEPDCDDYFFAELDSDTQQCVYRRGMYNAGVVIVVLCVIFEVTAFLVLQYSSLQIMGFADPESEGTLNATRPMNTYVDPVSAFLGRGVSAVLDPMIVLLKRVFPNSPSLLHEHED